MLVLSDLTNTRNEVYCRTFFEFKQINLGADRIDIQVTTSTKSSVRAELWCIVFNFEIDQLLLKLFEALRDLLLVGLKLLLGLLRKRRVQCRRGNIQMRLESGLM